MQASGWTPPSPGPGEGGTLARPRVLLADDTATVRLLLRRALEASDLFDVVGEAEDGEQAVELAAALQPDIVLLDLSMPVLDGMAAIPGIRGNAPAARVVVLSAFAHDGMGARALAAGASAFLEKNQRPGQLIASLQEVWAARPVPAPDRPDRHRAAWQHAPVAMALVAPDDRVLEANRSWHRLTGRPDGGPTVTELIHPDDREAAAAARRRVVEGRSADSTAHGRLVRPDGHTMWASIRCSASPEEGAVVVALVDVTDQSRVAQELARSNAELSSFAHLAAHELKSPLQVISGFAALLAKVHASQLDDHGREFVGWIVDGASRMNALIEDLLAYAEADRSEGAVGPVHLDAVLIDALDQVKTEAAGRAAMVEAGPLPVVTGDPVQLARLLQHLLANALTFVGGGRVPEVHVSAERVGQSWVVTVADNGIGVPDAAQERIFGMFERLHPRDRAGGGGMGLAICKRIVERRGGTIWVEANPGGGSRFRFSLPDVLSQPGDVPAA